MGRFRVRFALEVKVMQICAGCDTYAPVKVASSNPERFLIYFWDSKELAPHFSQIGPFSENEFRAKFAEMGHTAGQIDALFSNCSLI
jgi:hypothetical protein